MALEPEAGHQHQNGGELDHDPRPHQLVGPGAPKVSALEQGEHAQTQDDKDDREQDVEQSIDEGDHGADVGWNPSAGNGVGLSVNLKMFLLLRLGDASSRSASKMNGVPVHLRGMNA